MTLSPSEWIEVVSAAVSSKLPASVTEVEGYDANLLSTSGVIRLSLTLHINRLRWPGPDVLAEMTPFIVDAYMERLADLTRHGPIIVSPTVMCSIDKVGSTTTFTFTVRHTVADPNSQEFMDGISE